MPFNPAYFDQMNMMKNGIPPSILIFFPLPSTFKVTYEWEPQLDEGFPSEKFLRKCGVAVVIA